MSTTTTAIKFMKFYVTDGETKVKVWYSMDNRSDAPCITIYEDSYGRDLGKFFPDLYINNTDIQTDYFDKGHVTLRPGHPLYAALRARAEQNQADREARRNAPKPEIAFELVPGEIKGEHIKGIWTTVVRGVEYSIMFRPKPGYLGWFVSHKSNSRRHPVKGKWVRTPEDIESYFPRLRGIAAKLNTATVPVAPAVEAVVVAPAARAVRRWW